MIDVTELGSLAAEFAKSAGDLVAAQMAQTDVVATKSSATDIVTAVDRASEEHLVSLITKARPDDSILGEEGAARDGSTGVRWVLDPLDGTVNFTYGIPAFAVSVGVEVDGSAVVGAVCNPVTNELFTAAKGQGAYCNGTPLQVRKATTLNKALVATGFGYEADRRTEQAETLLHVLPRVRDIRRAGSAALDLCSVAAGRVDAYFELGPQRWDLAAGEVIASEAGALVTGFDRGQPHHDVIAAHPMLHSELRRLLTS